MWDGPYFVVERPEYTAKFLIGEQLPEAAEDADVHVRLADGTWRYASLFTLNQVAKILGKDRRTGETGGGAYFWCTDLVIVPEAGVSAMTRALDELVHSGEIETACQQIPPHEEN